MGMIMLFAETHKKKKRTSNHWCSRKVFRVDWKDYPLLKKMELHYFAENILLSLETFATN